MAKFLNNIQLEQANDIQFKTTAGTNAGKISQDGNNLVLTNAVGDILLGDGSADVYIGDGANNVDIIFEQSGAIKGDGSAVTLTLGGSNTTLNLENPNINGSLSINATTINNKLTFTTSSGYILFDYEPSGDTGQYTNEVPLIKVGHGSNEHTILARLSEYRAVVLGQDDTVWLQAGDTRSVITSNVGLTGEQVLMSAEGGFLAYGFPGNDTSWANRVEFQFRTDSTTASDNGLYIGDAGRTQFIDLSRNLKNIGTIGSGAITSTGKITGTELEGTSLDINGNADISGVLYGSSIVIDNTAGTRGIFRDNAAYDLRLGGGTVYSDGAYISLSGGTRGGGTTNTKGRVEIYSGGSNYSAQADITGDIVIGAQWNGGYSDMLTLDSSTNNATFAGAGSFAGTVIAPVLQLGNTTLSKSGDNNHAHFVGTALIPNTTTTSSNSNLGTSSYRWKGVYGGLGDFSGSVTATSLDINGDADISGNLAVNGTVDGVDISSLPTSFAPTNAEQNVQSNWNATSGDALILNKPSIPSISGLATTTYVDTAVANVVNSAPSTLNTLDELALALGDDPNFATTTATNIGTKLPKSGGTMSGNLLMGNSNITGVNLLEFNDPGPNEGLQWNGGNIKIYESPDNLTTNSAGNLQIVYGTTRRLTVNNSGIDVNGSVTVSGSQYFNGEFIEGDGKEMFRYSDTWLRINEDNDFSNGIYCGNGILRTDGEFQIGGSGQHAKITSSGNATFAGSVTANGVTLTGDQDLSSYITQTNADARYVLETGGSSSAMTGDLHIISGGPKIVLHDNTDDDDQAIIFRNNGNGDDYKIQTQDFTSAGTGDGLFIGSEGSDPVKLVTNDTIALTLDTSQNATFSGSVTISGNTTFKPKHYTVSNDLNSDVRTIFSTHSTNNATSNRPINYSTIYTLGGSGTNTLQISTNEDYSESGMWIRQYNANAGSPQGTGYQNWTEVWTTNKLTETNKTNYDTAYGWGDHGLSAQDKTDIGNLSGTNTGDQDLSGYATTSHNHDDRYYTETELDAGQLDNRYYTESESTTLFTRKYNFSPGNSGGSRRYVKLFTVNDFDASVVGKLSSAGDYGDSDRATYEIQIATRNNISFDVYQLSTDAVSDDYEFFYKTVGSTYEIWCKMGDYNQPQTFTHFSQYGTVAFNFDSITTTEPSGLVSVTKSKIFHEGHKPTFAEISTTPTTLAGYGITDSPSGNAIIDWSAANAGTIHTSNYIENVDYELPTAAANTLGGVKVGTNLSITATGVLSATDTNTVYTHPTTAGNKHIPSGGASGQFLKYTSSGTAVWATPSYIANTNTVDMGSGFIVANNGGTSQFTIVEDNALRFAGTGATTVAFNSTTKKVTIDSPAETYTAHESITQASSNVSNSGRTYLQSITLDSNGHVTGVATASETVVNTNTQNNAATTRAFFSGSGINTSTGVITNTTYTKASSTTLGLVKVGTGVTLAADGTISVEAQGNATSGDSGLMSASDKTKIDTIATNADVTNTTNVTSAGALMDSEVSVTNIKNIDQALESGAEPEFGTGNMVDSTNKRFMTDAQETKLDSVATGATANVGDVTLSGTQTISGNKTFSGNTSSSGAISQSNTTQSTNKSSGAFKTLGGVGIAKALNVGEDVVAYASSDKRYKDNLTPITNPIDKVKSLTGYTFTWNDKHEQFNGNEDIGVVAQEVEKVFPEIVDTRDSGYKAVKYEKMVAVLIEAIKDQQKQIDELKEKCNGCSK